MYFVTSEYYVSYEVIKRSRELIENDRTVR